MFVKPRLILVDGERRLANLRDPDRGDRLPAEGRNVPDTVYWRRRLREGAIERMGVAVMRDEGDAA